MSGHNKKEINKIVNPVNVRLLQSHRPDRGNVFDEGLVALFIFCSKAFSERRLVK